MFLSDDWDYINARFSKEAIGFLTAARLRYECFRLLALSTNPYKETKKRLIELLGTPACKGSWFVELIQARLQSFMKKCDKESMTNEEFNKTVTTQAINAFKDHELIESSDRRWFIAKRYEDGSLQGQYATEIISLRNGKLFVGGDIDNIVFGYYGNKDYHVGKVYWIGKHRSVDGYIKEKAGLGMHDDGSITEEYRPDIAREDLNNLLQEVHQDYLDNDIDPSKSESFTKVKQAIERAIGNADEEDYMIRNLMEDTSGELPDLWESVGNIGKVCAVRVFYAWAACRRLCELLDKDDDK